MSTGRLLVLQECKAKGNARVATHCDSHHQLLRAAISSPSSGRRGFHCCSYAEAHKGCVASSHFTLAPRRAALGGRTPTGAFTGVQGTTLASPRWFPPFFLLKHPREGFFSLSFSLNGGGQTLTPTLLLTAGEMFWCFKI